MDTSIEVVLRLALCGPQLRAQRAWLDTVIAAVLEAAKTGGPTEKRRADLALGLQQLLGTIAEQAAAQGVDCLFRAERDPPPETD